ncbi:ester cyclase [Anianabacter salinae]|uniref:ester cyclase n=1 Tax=Anianabacter salinae TaxID=2851023 RepID=UPI00225DE759|nr:ester cyclase [Anianabacter salinae]MBV0914023.1 ester cyclase [Anianabacter salinae]
MTHAPTLPASVRRAVRDGLLRLADCPPAQVPGVLEAISTPGTDWRVSHPINEVRGPEAAASAAFVPLKTAFPDLERRDTIRVGGVYEGRNYVAAVGTYCGTFRHDWLGIPATGLTAHLRYGEVYEVDTDGRILQANLLWDVLDLVRQAGLAPLAPSLGAEGMWPGPITGDGLRLDPSDPGEGAASIAQTLAMHASLAEFDDAGRLNRENLIAMPQRDHWHPKMMWYGPSGIGTTRGLDGFVDGHQLPFRIAFRRPQGTFEAVTAERRRHGAGHYIRIGDGPYSVTGGWPSVYAIHDGGGFCGMPPTGRPVTMRVMDFYLHDEGLIRENWVPLDMLDLFRQMGVDVLARALAKV